MDRPRILSQFVLLLAAVLLLLGPAPGASAADAPDYDIPNGHFYTQTGVQGGAGGTGFSITNGDGVPFWTAYWAWGGPNQLGYPISQRFTWKGLLSQVTQRGVLQWDPVSRQVRLTNLWDELSFAGFDAALREFRMVPLPGNFNEQGMTFSQIVAARLALLDADPSIKAFYLSQSDPLTLLGLPTSTVQDMGMAQVVRTQRGVLIHWKPLTGPLSGMVTLGLGGQIAAGLGLFDEAALAPESPPSLLAAAVPPPAPSGYAYQPRSSVAWEPNCGLTQIKIAVMDANNVPVNDVVARVAEARGWTADSNATGSDAYMPGSTDFALDWQPKAGTWTVWLLDSQGNQASQMVSLTTDTLDCGVEGSGHQIATVRFKGASAPSYGAGLSIGPAPAGSRYQPANTVSWLPNCGLTQIRLYVANQFGDPVSGVRFHVSADGFGADSFPTGYNDYSPGWTDFALDSQPRAITWSLWAIDDQGNQASPTVQVPTDTNDCSVGGSGHQVATTYWTRLS